MCIRLRFSFFRRRGGGFGEPHCASVWCFFFFIFLFDRTQTQAGPHSPALSIQDTAPFIQIFFFFADFDAYLFFLFVISNICLTNDCYFIICVSGKYLMLDAVSIYQHKKLFKSKFLL